jgi:dynein heavy chain
VEDRIEILEKVRGPANAAAGEDAELTPIELMTFFVGRCKDNLHVMLGMSPLGSTLATRLRMFPSLVNCCTIDWFTPWPEEALKVVAEVSLQEVELEDKERISVVALCQHFQSSVLELSVSYVTNVNRRVYVTPTSYLELFKAFKLLLEKKRKEILTAKSMYETGLEKILSAESQVGGMKEELIELQPQLVVAAAENVKMTAIITKESADAAVVEAAVSVDEADANEKAAVAKTEKEECEAILADAIPALNSALKALDTLKPSDIGEVKAMKDPPAPVKLVMEAVCVMKEVKAEKAKDKEGNSFMDFWGPAKKMLGDMKFLEGLKAYDKDNIPVKVMKIIREQYCTNESFKVEIIAKASKAAEGLCSWVLAMEIYDRVAKVVAPKKIALAAKLEEVDALMKVLKEKQDSLAAVKAKVAKLQADLDAKTKEKEELEAKVQLCQDKLERAEKLITGLGGEKVRWGAAATKLGADYLNVTGDILISSGVIAYLGPFTPAFRERCITEWVDTCTKAGIPCSGDYNLSKIVGDPVKTRQWHIDGLPTDNLSIDNGTMISNSRRWPLMIDPQGQANKWVKNMEKSNKLAVTKLTDATYMRTLENGIQFGNPVLIENVQEELDPSLEGLLLRNLFKQAGVMCIKLGESVIEYSPDFRFYITTKLPNPHYLPDVSTKVNLLNFMITVEGLEDQLLGIVVAKERPEVEEERQQLIVLSAANQKKLKEVEVKILETLSNSQGNILEDAAAIEVLDEAKIISDEVNAKQAIAEQTQLRINELRAEYKPVAEHSSVLFFVIDDLADIDPMYQYSLEWFVALFVSSIHLSNKSQNVQKRLRFLSDHFTYSLYVNVCRSLFEMHKLLFSFLLCSNLMKSRKQMEQSELMFLLTGGVGLDNPIVNPDPDWVQKSSWDELCRLADIPVFRGLREHFTDHLDAWKALYDSKMPQDFVEMPKEWADKLSGLQKLVLLRVIRPDKVVHAARAFVEDNLGQRFTQPPPFDLGVVYNDSTAMAPLIFVLSPGADPMAALLKFANDNGFSGEKFQSISLGQGQGPIASKMINTAREEGSWVCLQNCHLAVSWMNDLEKICAGLKPGTVHKDFRLWLTSYPTAAFPVSVLQNGVKMTNEPPAGLKNNMRQSFLNDPVCDPEFYNYFENINAPEKHQQFQKMCYGLCFFHALVQERRGFGPQGFNVPYGFNESDFVISVQQLKIFLDEYDVVPYDALQYLTGQCNYGGRVTDDWDRRCLISILEYAYSKPVVETPNFQYSAIESYCVPSPDGYQSQLDFLDQLPVLQPPEIFGMHENVDITKEMMQTRILLSSVLITQTKAGAGSGAGNERIEEVLNGILDRLPEAFDTAACTKKYPVVYEESMNTVLVQEMQRFNRLVVVIRKNLVNLRKALKGLVVMNSDLEDVFVCLGVGTIPATWKKASYPSLKPLGSYYNDLLRRLAFLQLWYDEGKPGAYWLPGFYFTQAFMTGALQNFARKYKVPIDNVAFDFEVLRTPSNKEIGKGPADGVHCYGLYLDGARWDKEAHELAEAEPKKLFVSMADIWFKPAKTEDIDSKGTYSCPVYKTSDRRGVLSTTGHSTNFVVAASIPTSMSQDHWIRRGLAMLTQLDD